MAAADPLECEVGAFEGAVFLESFDSVVGARWVEAAILSDDSSDGPLIEANQKDQESFHT